MKFITFLLFAFISSTFAWSKRLVVQDVPLLSVFLQTTTIGSNVFGTNILNGTSTINFAGVLPMMGKTELQGQVKYKNKSGPFWGLFTITAKESKLGLVVQPDGSASYNSKTGVTTFKAQVKIITGSGIWAGASGTGTFVGRRESALGSPVQSVLTVDVYGTK